LFNQPALKGPRKDLAGNSVEISCPPDGVAVKRNRKQMFANSGSEMKKSSGIGVVLSCAMLASAVFPGSLQARELTMLVSWSPGYPPLDIVDEFARRIEVATEGELRIRVLGPEAVPPFEQLEPLSSGLFDLLFTHPAYHTGTTGLALGLEASDGDPALRREVGAWDAVAAHYQDLNVQLISLPVSGREGFMILLSEPIGESGDLTGRRIRAAPIYQPLIEALGGSAVVLPPAEIYSALDLGVVDGAVWPIFGPLQFRWYEVAPYMMRPTFGVVTHQIFMSDRGWNALSSDMQEIFLDVGREIEEFSFEYFSNKAADELAAIVEAGGSYTDLGAEQTANLDAIWREGVWQLAEGISGSVATDLRVLLMDSGLTE
jgi:TRAP-type transport system periplasmic protein